LRRRLESGRRASLSRNLASRCRNRPASIPADRQTNRKSQSSRNRNCSASRLRRSGPDIHSSMVLTMTACQTRSSIIDSSLPPLTSVNIAFPPSHVCVTRPTTRTNAMAGPTGSWRMDIRCQQTSDTRGLARGEDLGGWMFFLRLCHSGRVALKPFQTGTAGLRRTNPDRIPEEARRFPGR
jgi:hypothetical protein